MSKMIKTTDTELKIETSKISVIEIGTLRFEQDYRYPWIDIYAMGGENKEFVTQLDSKNVPIATEPDELKRFCLNWYFNNVEIVGIKEE